MSKSKAIQSFLKALSHQIPNESLDPLLKPENDALFVLLNSSIEALPMGSSIRKEVDLNMQRYILVFRKELEQRKSELEKKMVLKDEQDGSLLPAEGKIPLLNSSLFHFAFNKSNVKDMERYLCSDYATGEIILSKILTKGKKKTAGIHEVNAAFQHAFSARQLSSLDEYIQLFVDAMESHNGRASDVASGIKTFLKLILFSRDALGVPFDTMKAIDLGKIVGELISIATSTAEEYNIVLMKANHDDDDESSDEESLKVLPLKTKSKAEFMAVKEDCIRDALSVLCTVYSFTNTLDASKVASAYLTTGIIGVFQDKSESDTNAFKESTEILVKALGCTHVMDKHELPSTKIVHDATKRCQILSSWVERVLNTASLQSQTVEEESTAHNNPIFVMDTVANDVSMESDSSSNEDDDSNDESEHSRDSDSDEDVEEPMFVLDTEKSDVSLAVNSNGNEMNAEDEEDEEQGDDDDDDNDEDDNDNYEDDNSEVKIDRRSDVNITKSTTPPSKKNSKTVLQPVPEDEEVDPTSNKDAKSETILATPSRRTRSNSNMSNLSTDTPTRMTRSRVRGMSTSSVDTLGQESVNSSASKTTPRSTRKRSASAASETPVATRRSSRRLK
jgi:hypothetical protein